MVTILYKLRRDILVQEIVSDRGVSYVLGFPSQCAKLRELPR